MMTNGVKRCFGSYCDGSVPCCCCDRDTRDRCREHYRRTYELSHVMDAMKTVPEVVNRAGAELASIVKRAAR